MLHQICTYKQQFRRLAGADPANQRLPAARFQFHSGSDLLVNEIWAEVTQYKSTLQRPNRRGRRIERTEILPEFFFPCNGLSNRSVSNLWHDTNIPLTLPLVGRDRIQLAHENLSAGHCDMRPGGGIADLPRIEQFKPLRVGLDEQQLPAFVQGQDFAIPQSH